MKCPKCFKGNMLTCAIRRNPSGVGAIEYKQCRACGVHAKFSFTRVDFVDKSSATCDCESVGKLRTYTTKPHSEQRFSTEYKRCAVCGSTHKYYSTFLDYRSYDDDEMLAARVLHALRIYPELSDRLDELIRQVSRQTVKMGADELPN